MKSGRSAPAARRARCAGSRATSRARRRGSRPRPAGAGRPPSSRAPGRRAGSRARARRGARAGAGRPPCARRSRARSERRGMPRARPTAGARPGARPAGARGSPTCPARPTSPRCRSAGIRVEPQASARAPPPPTVPRAGGPRRRGTARPRSPQAHEEVHRGEVEPARGDGGASIADTPGGRAMNGWPRACLAGEQRLRRGDVHRRRSSVADLVEGLHEERQAREHDKRERGAEPAARPVPARRNGLAHSPPSPSA